MTVGWQRATVAESTGVDRASRPHGKRFGILVHAVLAVVPLDAHDDVVVKVVHAQARLHGASELEEVAAGAAVKGVLSHPWLERARLASDVRREVSITHVREDGSLLEGVIDLAFRETKNDPPTWTLIDFKTDVEIASRRAEYEVQLSLYAKALTAATGEATIAGLLSV